MSAFTTITLDTTPPAVSFGEPSGTNAGDFFSIPYLLDEPEAITAQLRLADNTVLALEVGEDTLSVLLPVDTVNGNARISVRDDVGNPATKIVFISGVIPPPPPQSGLPAGGMPRRPAPRKVEVRSEIHLRSEFLTHVPRRLATQSRISISSTATITRVAPVPAPRPEPTPPPPPKRLKIATRVTVATSFTSRQPARLAITSSTHLRARYTTERDDGGEVARLVALGII